MLFLVATAVSTFLALQAPLPGATITGVVSDAETGAPVADAAISITGTTLASWSQADGSYVVSGVPEGSYAVAVARSRFHPRTFRAIVPSQGAVRIDIALHPAPTTLPPIEVQAPYPEWGHDRENWTFADRRVSVEDVRSDPRLAESDALLALEGGGVTLRPESPEGLHLLGGASDQVAYAIDGIPVFSPYHGGGTFGAWNPDALARLDVRMSPAAPAESDGLSGSVSATTLSPAPHHEVRGSVSSTQARSTFDGPLGWSGAGYLISLRSNFPGLLGHSREASYLDGESSDWLAKVESPLAGGRIRFLGYDSDNEISASQSPMADGAPQSRRNGFSWESQSFGADWSGQIGRAGLIAGLWSAGSDAGALWPGDSGETDQLATHRQDVGAQAGLDLGGAANLTSLRIRARRTATSYRVGRDAISDASFDQAIVLWSAGLTHSRSTSARSSLVFSLGAEAAGGAYRLDPGAEFRWRPTRRLSISAGISRRHQFAQSLRNEESVVGAIFPADLFVGSGSRGVPVARSDFSLVTLEYRPEAGTRITWKAYLRRLGGLVLVAPFSSGPFLGTGPSGFLAGSGTSAGVSLEASAAGPNYGLLLIYGLQRTRLTYGDSSYTPAFGIAHALEAGATLLPSANTTLKVGATALFGRHGTAVTGPFEWESCNLLDHGCEFQGSPRQATQELGLLDLPAYLRLDLGVRHRWLLHVGGRDAELGLFGTLTNLLNRQNVLTEVIDPVTGVRGRVDMRPRSPLTVGLDWRY